MSRQKFTRKELTDTFNSAADSLKVQNVDILLTVDNKVNFYKYGIKSMDLKSNQF